MGSEKVVFLGIFIHPIENSGSYFFRGRLFWRILDINLQNFARGYFSKFSLRALHLDDALDLRAANCLDLERNLEAYFFVWSSQVKIKVYRNFRACRGKYIINSNPSFVVSNIEVGRLQEACDQPTGCTRLGERGGVNLRIKPHVKTISMNELNLLQLMRPARLQKFFFYSVSWGV